MKTRINFFENNANIDMLIKMDLLFEKIDKFISFNKNKPKIYRPSDMIYLKTLKINIDFTGNVIADTIIILDAFDGSMKLAKELKNIISLVSISSGKIGRAHV